MKTKMLTALAVLALAFAGFAIAAEQTDAEGELDFTLDASEYYVKATDTNTVTITVTLAEAVSGTALTVNATSATEAAVTLDTASKEVAVDGTYTTFTATYAGQGSSVITFSATGYNNKAVTVYAGIQEITPAKTWIVAGTTAQSITITGLNASNETITAEAAATSSKLGTITAGAMTSGSVSLSFTPEEDFVGSEIINLSVTGTDLTASVIVYSANAAAMGYIKNSNVQAMVFSDAVIYMDTSSIDTSQTPMVYFEIDFNATGTPDGTPDLVVGPMAAQKRMTIEIPGYILFDGVGKTTITIKNWSDKSAIATFSEMAFNENISFTLDPNMPVEGYTAYKSNGTEFVSEYAASGTTFLTRTTTVDTYIMSPSFSFIGWAATADATEASFPDLVVGEGEGITEIPAAPTISEYFFATYGNTDTVETEEVYIIYAIWDDKLTIEVLYWYGGAAVDSLNGNVYSAAAASASDTVFAKVIQVPSYARVGDSFLLRIQQETAGNYTYDVTLYTKYEWNATSGAVDSTEATLETARMITNGVWLVDDISENIKIVVTATASAGPVTGYHFAIDEVSSGPANYALLSWDAIDYKPVGDIKIGGTYFHQVTGIGNVYGDLSLLESVNELTYALTVDNVAQTAPTENTVNLEGTYNSHDESYNFDYKVTVGTGYTIYAAQGLWDNDVDEDYDVFTPWSLIAQTSS